MTIIDKSYQLKMKGMKKINEKFYVDKEKALGQGNFGTVYKGYRVDENRIIAVKFMNQAQLQKNPEYKRQLVVMEEIAKLNHPNIMGYYGYEIKPEGLYCFLQFCSGGQLKSYCKKKISEIKALSLFQQLLEAMTYINGLNKIHRDLKPQNILLDQSLDLKIADFGLARDLEICMTKGACTPLYAAPQVYSMLQYDQKCDVWSSGLILYEILTGQQLFKHVKTKADLRQQLEKAKKGEKIFKYPKQLHKNWTLLTQKMLTYDKAQRPSFRQLLQYFENIKQQMEKDLSKKYDTAEGIEQQITDSKKRLRLINPYLTNKRGDQRNLDGKLQEEKSYQKYQMAQRYLIFLRMKNDFMCKIIKSFTENPYAILKNVYKYILMFLAVSCYISKLTQAILDLKNKQVNTPQGLIRAQDIAENHLKEWEELIQDTKSKHTVGIERFRNVLQKQIVDKILKSYMNREQENKILSSYGSLIEWIQETRKGNFMKPRFYIDLYVKVMNDSGVHITDQKLKTLEMKDLRTYGFIRLTGHLDSFLNDENFMDEDYIRVKKQELENFKQPQLTAYIIAYNSKT